MTAFNSKWKSEKLAVVVHVPQTPQNQVISRSCFAEEGKEMSITTVLEPLAATLMIDHFTVVCSPTWPVNGSEGGGDLVLLLYLLVSTRAVIG